jgi:hypothetical protein
MDSYQKWKKEHPNFLGFTLAEWDNGIFRNFIPVGRAFGFDKEIDGKPYTPAYIKVCKTTKVERDFPAFYPRDREELVQLIEKEFKYQKRVLFDDAFAMISFTNWYHYPLEWGAKLFIIESTGGGLPNRELQYAFARGISRQYGKPWAVYWAFFLAGGGYVNHLSEGMSGNYKGAPDCGISASLFRRGAYLAYLSGASYFEFEHPKNVPFAPGKDGKYEFSPHGKAMKEVFDFSQNHDRGAVYAPIGLLMDYAHGWTAYDGARPGVDLKVFYGMFQPTDGDRMTDAVLKVIFPWKWSYEEDNNGYCMTNTPFGDIFDVVIPNPPSGVPVDALNKYKALVLLGDIKFNRALADALVDYVGKGGTLVVNATQLNEYFPKEFYGVLLSDSVKTEAVSKAALDNKIIDAGKSKFNYRTAELISAVPIVVSKENAPLITVNKYKQGRVILTLQNHMLSSQKAALPTVQYLLNMIKNETLPFSVEGDIEYILNKNEKGWWVTLINNKGVFKTSREAPVIKPEYTAKVTVSFKEMPNQITELISGEKIEYVRNGSSAIINLSVAPGDVKILEITK